MKRICTNEECGWAGNEEDCLDFKSPFDFAGHVFCPKCNSCTEPLLCAQDEIIKQLGYRPDVKFRPFTKSELDARKPTDPRSEAERELDDLAKDEADTIKSIRPGC